MTSKKRIIKEIKKILEIFQKIEWLTTNDKDETDEDIEERVDYFAEKIYKTINEIKKKNTPRRNR